MLGLTPNVVQKVEPGHDSQSKNKKTWGCAIIIAAWFVIFGVADHFGCKWTESGSNSTSVTASKPTKAEWLAKAASRYGQYVKMRIIYDWRTDDFRNFMGAPDSTQTVGDKAFWYYYCSDGEIQLSMYAPNLIVGIMQGEINDY
jgi:hypothetical protein